MEVGWAEELRRVVQPSTAGSGGCPGVGGGEGGGGGCGTVDGGGAGRAECSGSSDGCTIT